MLPTGERLDRAVVNTTRRAYISSVSATHGFGFTLDPELSEDSLVAVIVTTPAGGTVQIWAEVELAGRTAILRQFAIYGVDIGRGGLGAGMLRGMALAAMENFDVDCIRIEEARRTARTAPTRILRPIEFRRRGR
jgi:hypothetical protein